MPDVDAAAEQQHLVQLVRRRRRWRRRRRRKAPPVVAGQESILWISASAENFSDSFLSSIFNKFPSRSYIYGKCVFKNG
jgi:hypothetical protein